MASSFAATEKRRSEKVPLAVISLLPMTEGAATGEVKVPVAEGATVGDVKVSIIEGTAEGEVMVSLT